MIIEKKMSMGECGKNGHVPIGGMRGAEALLRVYGSWGTSNKGIRFHH